MIKRGLFLLSIFALSAACTTSAPEAPLVDESWLDSYHQNQYVGFRDFLHLNKKNDGANDGVTIIAAPAFDPVIGIEVIHFVARRVYVTGEPDYLLRVHISDLHARTHETFDDVHYSTDTIEKYSAPLTAEEYETIISGLRKSQFMTLATDQQPEFECNDGIDILVDITTTDKGNRFIGRHDCDDGFDALNESVEPIYKFVDMKIPQAAKYIAIIRRYSQ